LDWRHQGVDSDHRNNDEPNHEVNERPRNCDITESRKLYAIQRMNEQLNEWVTDFSVNRRIADSFSESSPMKDRSYEISLGLHDSPDPPSRASVTKREIAVHNAVFESFELHSLAQ
jgi:hypothetical protein